LTKVSVIIPVYNSEKFLKHCIESIFNQSYDNLEVIAVDDGSTDKSSEILHKYKNKITIISQENKGLANALNTSIKNMNGKWFKWISPDDILVPNSIQTLVTNAQKLPENSIVYSNWEIIDEENKSLRNFSESNFNDLDTYDFNVRLLDGQQINVNTTLIPSSLFEKGCLFRQLDDSVAIDYDFFLRAGIFYNTKFFLTEKNLVKYRIHTNQLSHKNIANTLSYLTEIRENILSQLEKSEREKYQKALKNFEKQKSFSKKTMELGLKFVTSILPNGISDDLLVFYLNKIRSTR